jgi:hypothetical protein
MSHDDHMATWELRGLVTISAQSHGATERKEREKAYMWSKSKSIK